MSNRYFVDDQGRYLGGFAGVGATPPQGAIEVQSPPSHAADLWAGNAWVPHLGHRRADAHAEIDAQAGRARARFITVAPGQEMTYLEKTAQARALEADPGQPNAQTYPLIFAEIGVTAEDAAAVAAVVLQRYSLWQQIGAVIEGERLTAKRAVDEAATAEEIAAIIDDLSWPVPE